MQPIDVVEPQPIELPKRESHQLKALLSKNIRLQSKQKCTNVCQILTPVICLLFTFLMKELASEGLPAGSVYEDNLYPYVFNNYQQFDTLNPGMRRNNLQWFLYNCQNQCDASLLGYNDGERREVGLLSAIPAINTNVSFYPDAYNNQS